MPRHRLEHALEEADGLREEAALMRGAAIVEEDRRAIVGGGRLLHLLHVHERRLVALEALGHGVGLDFPKLAGDRCTTLVSKNS